ncbi:MAG: helix-turn-helix transcriptional regulator [Proteobacteria bacterium]|nr:helix-turn-helix transcriptional regulator [Pseudomonadota bacterium]
MNNKILHKPAKAIIEISSATMEIQNFYEFPQAIESIISKYIPLDWMSMYSNASDGIKTITNPSLSFNWNTLYSQTATYDYFGACVQQLNHGDFLINQDVIDPASEEQSRSLEFAKKHTGTNYFMGLMGFKSQKQFHAYGFYREDIKKPFTSEDKVFFSYLSPLFVSISNTLLLYLQNDFMRAGLDYLMSGEPIKPLIFNKTLKAVEIPKKTLKLLSEAFGKSNCARLPIEIVQWINTVIAPRGYIEPNTGPWLFRRDLDGKILVCKAYVLLTPGKRLYLMIKTKFIHSTVDFSMLKEKQLTKREIEMLEYLPKGYTNNQIAKVMGIKEVSVKKYIKNVAMKLGASGKTETLYRALIEKNLRE